MQKPDTRMSVSGVRFPPQPPLDSQVVTKNRDKTGPRFSPLPACALVFAIAFQLGGWTVAYGISAHIQRHPFALALAVSLIFAGGFTAASIGRRRNVDR
jgi:hypothetical protein